MPGKTFLIKYFIERLGISYDNVLFVAYMGKAATQMSRTGLPAKTIHSAIYDYQKVIARDENDKIIFKENGKPKMVSQFVLKDKIYHKKGCKVKLIVVDEAAMVEEKIAKDLLSFNIPVIALGDLNQLPPVFGNSFFLNNPNVILTKIMRQAEGNPIIWLSQQILAGNRLKYGVYGNSAVISKGDITDYQFKNNDIVITGTNRLRFNVNNYYREELKKIKQLEYPHIGEKVMCRKNNWNKKIDDGIYLTNGLTGYVDYIDRKSYNGKSMSMDFRPDFTKSYFKDIVFDYKHMYSVPGSDIDDENTPNQFWLDKMEYAYAITVHSSQGSQYDRVLFLDENIMRNDLDRKRFEYTAITRAINSITIVL